MNAPSLRHDVQDGITTFAITGDLVTEFHTEFGGVLAHAVMQLTHGPQVVLDLTKVHRMGFWGENEVILAVCVVAHMQGHITILHHPAHTVRIRALEILLGPPQPHWTLAPGETPNR